MNKEKAIMNSVTRTLKARLVIHPELLRPCYELTIAFTIKEKR